MLPPFEEALEALLDQYAATDREDVISALELKLMTLREERAGEEEESNGD